MLRYNGDEWTAESGTLEIELSPHEHTRMAWASAYAVTILGLVGKDWVPLYHSDPGYHTFHAHIKGFETLRVTGKAFGFASSMKSKQIGEPLDDIAAPVVPMPTMDDNLVLKLSNVIRQELRNRSLPVMEPDALDPVQGGYEIEDDDTDFEEEIAAKQIAASKAALIKKEKASPAGQPTVTPAAAEPPPEPEKEPPAPPTSEEE